MEEYNRLEVNLAETAAVDDSQEEIIVLEQYQPHSDPHSVLSITDDSLRGIVKHLKKY
jgi:predicted phosphohydrolase